MGPYDLRFYMELKDSNRDKQVSLPGVLIALQFLRQNEKRYSDGYSKEVPA